MIDEYTVSQKEKDAAIVWHERSIKGAKRKKKQKRC